MNHAVIVKSQTASSNIDAYMRNAVAEDDLDNGNIFILETQRSDGGVDNEVWEATAPVTGKLAGVWVACSPWTKVRRGEVIGDPREMYNEKGKVFDAAFLQPKDVFTVTAEALGGTAGDNKYVVATNGSFKMTWAAEPVAGAFCAKLIKQTTIGDSAFSLPAFKFEVIRN